MLTKAYIRTEVITVRRSRVGRATLANQHGLVLGANTSKRFFQRRGWDPTNFDYVIVGSTVYQKQCSTAAPGWPPCWAPLILQAFW